MPHPFKLLLFDLDGTLMLSGGAGSRAIDTVFVRHFGVANAFDGIQPHGMTDPMIFRELFERHGLEISDEAGTIAQLAEEYRRELSIEMPVSKQAHLMPGVVPLLERLAAAPGVVMGLLTGNFEPTARIKLTRFDLNRFFPFGAFSTDSANRSDLPPVAIRRAEEHVGRLIGRGPHVYVIGDTPMDVRCALDNGVTSVGVATTKFTVDDLRQAGAHIVLDSFADTEMALNALGVPS
ncbi:MAG: haloacid dehalogenase-like hydrolase [Deltaproteobacteria bacterium]|nr:haloacid dehalogenase-like hydrolase [Deltaproteobacteria bacterium]